MKADKNLVILRLARIISDVVGYKLIVLLTTAADVLWVKQLSFILSTLEPV